eukprot:TRINITY_DN3486_c0_g1_i20.p6 TRINITY_DN3486_c0_g1~~TRINITY_DN3486_c0_g1_i20.p6  ORF type:complete len:119 (-),score=0.84 TRINITY_DN3486_c0_g1_i20:1254-1610(-)
MKRYNNGLQYKFKTVVILVNCSRCLFFVKIVPTGDISVGITRVLILFYKYLVSSTGQQFYCFGVLPTCTLKQQNYQTCENYFDAKVAALLIAISVGNTIFNAEIISLLLHKLLWATQL